MRAWNSGNLVPQNASGRNGFAVAGNATKIFDTLGVNVNFHIVTRRQPLQLLDNAAFRAVLTIQKRGSHREPQFSATTNYGVVGPPSPVVIVRTAQALASEKESPATATGTHSL